MEKDPVVEEKDMRMRFKSFPLLVKIGGVLSFLAAIGGVIQLAEYIFGDLPSPLIQVSAQTPTPTLTSTPTPTLTIKDIVGWIIIIVLLILFLIGVYYLGYHIDIALYRRQKKKAEIERSKKEKRRWKEFERDVDGELESSKIVCQLCLPEWKPYFDHDMVQALRKYKKRNPLSTIIRTNSDLIIRHHIQRDHESRDPDGKFTYIFQRHKHFRAIRFLCITLSIAMLLIPLRIVLVTLLPYDDMMITAVLIIPFLIVSWLLYRSRSFR